MIGALYRYLREADPRYFQPMNANFGLLDELQPVVRDKRLKRERLASRALAALREWIATSLGDTPITGDAAVEDHARA
jgi:methylenetetrahydrofolate--tRNA-(uracil-5-)-methyltransferase